jgi:hypothetical protein
VPTSRRRGVLTDGPGAIGPSPAGSQPSRHATTVITTIAPCPRRDAGPFRWQRGDVGHHPSDRGQGPCRVALCPRRDAGWVAMGHHLPDRGQGAMVQRHIAPCPRRDGGPSVDGVASSASPCRIAAKRLRYDCR